jgi:hypothetical protein
MATIINTLERRIADANSRNKSRQPLRRSFLMGTMGYLVFLFTLATTYWFTSAQFRFGLSKIDANDLIFSTIGFFAFFAPYFFKSSKHNYFRK